MPFILIIAKYNEKIALFLELSADGGCDNECG
jgi:hypothetical protein